MAAAEAEAQARAARHAIYKEGVATREQVLDNVVSRESLTAKGFVENPDTGDWRRPRKDEG